jgi:hypothetical protein
MEPFGSLSQRALPSFAAAQLDCRPNLLIETERLRPEASGIRFTISILLKNPNHQKLAPEKTIETPSGKIKTVYTPAPCDLLHAPPARTNARPAGARL